MVHAHHLLHHKKTKVLFILKRRHGYYHDGTCGAEKPSMSTGLFNSANFVYEMLVNAGVDCKIVVVVDNNCIDREVAAYKPTHVIIEALWVVPEKFVVLQKLHPHVKWIVRLHSDLPFLANEGIAMKWINGYLQHKNVHVAPNAPRALEEIRFLAKNWGVKDVERKVIYLPNYYPVTDQVYNFCKAKKDIVNVGCFGAIRPMKNQLIQAVAAVKFADRIKKKLHFHVNVGRIEQKGDPVLNNLIALFDGLASKGHKLVMHPWCPHEEFQSIICQMDIGLQVSFSETFNIVAADMVTNGIPVVVSKEVPWASHTCIADPTSSCDIANNLYHGWKWSWLNVWLNARLLEKYVTKTEQLWLEYFKH